MDFFNDICFPLILFFFYFAIFSAFTPKTATPVTTEEYNPLDDIKRAFSSEFDPEPPLQLTVNSYQLSVKETVEDKLVPSLKSFSIRQLRSHIREHKCDSFNLNRVIGG